MEGLTKFVLFMCIGLCSCMNSWEIPEGNVWDQLNRGLDDNWTTFKKVHNKTYEDLAEELKRRMYWEDALRFIEEHNKRYLAGEETYTVGENHFSDLAEDEFHYMYMNNLMIPEDEVYPEGLTEPDPDVPDEVNWRGKLTTLVKQQGTCGSCWAFSAVGALEGQLLKKYPRIADASVQDLVDCASQQKGYSCNGCSGGWMTEAFKYIKQNGINAEYYYPYVERDSRCNHNKDLNMAYIKNYTTVGNTEYSLQSDVAKVGPIAIAAYVVGRGFTYYKAGIYYNPDCYRFDRYLNHAMLATGYGSKNATGKDYWIVKNSWGQDWGEEGYVYMTRNDRNNCGIASKASYPTL